PQRGVVPLPAQEPEIAARQAGRPVAGDQRRFDAEGARATQRIEEFGTRRRQLGPAGAQQYAGGDVFLQRCLAARRPVPAAVQAVAGQVDGERDAGAVRVRVHPYVGALGGDVGTRAARLAQRVDDAVLELERTEMRMGDGRVTTAEV